MDYRWKIREIFYGVTVDEMQIVPEAVAPIVTPCIVTEGLSMENSTDTITWPVPTFSVSNWNIFIKLSTEAAELTWYQCSCKAS